MGDIKFYSPVDFDDTSSGVTIEGDLTANKGVKFAGGSIGQAKTVLHTNNILYARGGSGGMYLQNGDGSEGILISSDHIKVETGGLERLRINSSGNVGIGTTSPDAKLSVTSSTINSEDILYLKSGADNVNDYLGIAWELGVGGNGPHSAIRSFAGPSGSDARLGFLTTSDGGTTLTEGLSIAHNSNIGIGTTSPSHKLEVVGDIKTSGTGNTRVLLESGGSCVMDLLNAQSEAYLRTTTAHDLHFRTTDTNRMVIKAGGSVGIGTTSPGTINGVAFSGVGLHTKAGTLGRTITEGTSFAEFIMNHSNASANQKVKFVLSKAGVLELGSMDDNGTRRTQLSILNNNNVGIGTTSPSAPLHVVGNSYVQNGTFYTDAITAFGGTSISINAGSSHLAATVNSAERMRITSAGNVGIGTNSPSTRLDVRLSTTTGKVAELHNSVGYGVGFTVESDGGVNTINSESNQALAFATNGASNERMRVTSAGNVGIGTTSPSQKLEVHGNIFANISNGQGFLLTGPASGLVRNNATGLALRTNTTDQLIIDGSGNATFAGSVTISNASPALNLTDTDNSSNIAFSSVGGALVVNSPSDQVYQIGGTEKFRVGSSTSTFSGNVTLNGDGKLLKFTPTSYDDVELGIDSNGFVIYNTTDARYDLKINGDGNATFGGSVTIPEYLKHTDDADTYFGFSANNQVLFHVGGGDRLIINSSGNVGVGTTSPSSKLHVAGTLGVTGSATLAGLSASSVTTPLVQLQGDLNVLNKAQTAYITLADRDTSGSEVVYNLANVGSATFAGKINAKGGASVPGFTAATINAYTATVSSNLYSALRIVDNTAASTYWDIGAVGGASPDLKFFVNASTTPKFTLSTNGNALFTGNVGIGTTSPSEKLEVTGQIVSTASNSTSATAGVERAIMDLSSYSATDHSVRFGHFRGATAAGAGQLRLYTDSVERLRINASGYVGIGTTSPAQKLHVSGNFLLENNNEIRQKDSGGTQRTIIELDSSNDLNIGGSYAGALKFIGGGSYAEVMRIHDNGNVGVGVASPSTKLEVVSSQSNSSIKAGGLEMQSYAVNNSWYAENLYYDGAWKLRNAGFATQMYMELGKISFKRVSSGNAGASVSPETTMVLAANGNVGVGTTSPSQKLHVDGHALISAEKYYYVAGGGAGVGSDASGNLILRQNSANLMTTSGSNATFAGDVLVEDNLYLTDAGTVRGKLILNASDRDNVELRAESLGSTMKFFTASTEALGLDASQNATFAGDVTLGTGDNLYLNGTSGLRLLHDGSNGLIINQSTGDLKISNSVTDKDIIFIGKDGASTITALTLDMSDGGWATFNSGIHVANTFSPSTFGKATFAGNVGIGTTSPTRKLQITDGEPIMRFNPTTVAGDYRFHAGDGKFYVTPEATGAPTMTYSSGNVGIGTTSPAEKLTVSGDANITGKLAIGSSAAHSSFAFYNQLTAYFNGAVTIDDTLTQSGGGNSTFSGSVGIGTTSPGAKLNVVGTGTQLGSSGYYYNTYLKDTTNSGVLLGGNNTNNGVGFLAGVNELAFLTYGTSWGERMRINSSGNVGIGTTSPQAKLDIKGDGADFFLHSADFKIARIQPRGTGANLDKGLFSLFDGSTEDVRIDTEGSSWLNGGNVGIGTTSPSAKLHVRSAFAGSFTYDTTADDLIVESNANGGITIATAAANTGRVIFASPDDATGSEISFNASGALMKIGTTTGSGQLVLQSGNGSEALRANSSGNIGIGTTSPGQKLEVNGTVKSSGLHVTAAPRIDATATPGNAAAGQSLSPTQAQVKNGGNPDYYLSEPDEWLVVNISGTDYVLPAYEV